MIQETLAKFGHPVSLIKEYCHWMVLLRPKQVTLGSLIIICKEDATAFPKISVEAFRELQEVTADVESMLATGFQYDKVNYLMLMMVDPEVHFHVIPRYSKSRTFEGQNFTDEAWPGPPNLQQANQSSEECLRSLKEHLQALINHAR